MHGGRLRGKRDGDKLLCTRTRVNKGRAVNDALDMTCYLEADGIHMCMDMCGQGGVRDIFGRLGRLILLRIPVSGHRGTSS